MSVSNRLICSVTHFKCKKCFEDCLEKAFISDIKINITFDDTEGNGFYDSTKSWVNVVIKTMFPIISVFGALGNIAIIFIVMRLPWLRRSYTNFFLVNMALADLSVLIWCVNLTAIEYVDPELYWVLGPALCKFNHFVQILSYTSSILILLLMCLERYIAIIFPMKVKEMLSKKIYVILLILIWLISGGFSLPSIFNYELTRSGNITICKDTRKINRKKYYICTFILLYVLPLLVMSSLYGHMSFNLWKSIQPLKSIKIQTVKRLNSTTTMTLDDSNQENQEISIVENGPHYSKINLQKKKVHKKKAVIERRRVILMLIVIVVVFTFCRLPRHVWALIYLTNSLKSHSILLIFPPMAFMLMYLSSAINPFVYFAFSKSFRKNFLKAVFCYSSDNIKKGQNIHMSNSKGFKSNTVLF